MNEKSQEKQESIDSQKSHKSIGARIGSVYKRAKAYLEEKKDSISSFLQKNYQKLSQAVTEQVKDSYQSIKPIVEPKDKSAAENVAPKPSKINKEQAKKYLKEHNVQEDYIQKLEKVRQPPLLQRLFKKQPTSELKFRTINSALYQMGGNITMGARSVDKAQALFEPLIEQHAIELQASIVQGREAFENKLKEFLSTPAFLEKIKEQTDIEVKLYNQLYGKNVNCLALAGIKVDKKLDEIIRRELCSGLVFAEHQHNIKAAIEDIAKGQAVNLDFKSRIGKKAEESEKKAKVANPEGISEVELAPQATTRDSVPEIEEENQKEEEKEKQAEQIEQQVSSEPESEPEVLATKLESEQEELQQEEQEQKEQEAQEEVLTQSSEKKSQKDEPNTQPMPVMNTDSLLSKLQSALDGGSTASLGVKARIAQFEGHTTEKKVESKKSQDSETIPQRTQVKSMINMFNSYQKSQHTERAVDPETPEKSRSVKLR
ncbi:MAG: hypothetical protein AB7D28_03075 [Candidatus Berkiella sp.]